MASNKMSGIFTNIHDGQFSEQDKADFRRMIERKGKRGAAADDPGFRMIMSEAEKLDVQRRGLLMALADLCMRAYSTGIPAPTIVECLQGAAEGMEHV